LLSHNVFAYCQNNVVNMSDPDGNWSISTILQSVKGAISNVVNTIAKHVVATVATVAITVAAVVGIHYLITHPRTASILTGGGGLQHQQL
jgi:hypothetical protein